MENECVVANEKPSDTKWLPDTARHLFLSCDETESILNDSMEKRSPTIQTLLLFRSIRSPLQHLPKYKSLHALELCTWRESFLPQPKYLHHLRYLDLSNSLGIKALPEDISILYNLQMLDLSNCFHLERLPRQMKYMTSLRHLYTHGCLKLKSMPPELGKLTKLQTLTCFVATVTGPDCSDVAELEHLNLGGKLELCQMENINIEAKAKVANLGNKNDLKELKLRWTYVCDSEVLNNFKPHDGLEVLRVYYYGGKDMGMLQNMVEIYLFCCERLQVLFSCGTSFIFPKLKQLTLEHLYDFERWWEINERQEGQIIFPVLEKLFIRCCRKLVALPEAPLLEQPYNGGCSSAFPVLKVLEMEDLKSFQKWDAVVGGEHILFPQLEKLSIKKCPKLMDLPEAPNLGVLEIEDGKQEIFHWVDRYLSSLTQLTLRLENTETTSGSECTSMLPVDSREKWNQKSPLTVLEFGCCNTFFGSGGVEPWDYFVHLGVLRIDRCDVLVHWPVVVFNSLVSLKTLNITWCNHLTGYTQGPFQPSAFERSQHLPALEFLYLEQCASLVGMFNVPATLKEMRILLCSKLESIFGKQQVGTSELVQGSSCSEPIVPTAVSHLSSSPVNHFFPCLEYLRLYNCDSLSGVLHLPPFLKTILIESCSSIQVLSCQLDGPPIPEVTASINAPDPSAATAAEEHSLPPCLTSLDIYSCAGMLGGILRLPTSLKELTIKDTSGLTSLDPVSGQPLSLEDLCLVRCSALASLPNEPQAYGSLQNLEIKDCPALKKLPRCLQQRLGNIKIKYLDAQYEVLAFKPKTWKEIPRVVRQRRRDAKWRAWERRRAIEEQEAPAVHTGE
uniref:Uncharacterized protein n=1 Tax=Avena sativa TaxID=4498 RepID=A0ACD5ZLJ1_AVESA